jgi:hypothetical protein
MNTRNVLPAQFTAGAGTAGARFLFALISERWLWQLDLALLAWA